LVGSAQGANNQEGRSQSERTNRRKRFPREADSSGMLETSRVFSLYSMTSAGAEEMGKSTRWVSRRKLKAAILESLAVKARKVWNPGRMILECQRPAL